MAKQSGGNLATLEGTAEQEQEYHLIVRHVPFVNRPKTIMASSANDAWRKFIALAPSLLADPNIARDPSEKQVRAALKQAQQEWIKQQNADEIPADVTIMPESEFRQRLAEQRAQSAEMVAKLNRKSQENVQDILKQNAELMERLARSQEKTTELLGKLADRSSK